MKLYYSRGACSLAVRIILHEIGLSSQYEAVDLATKKTEDGQDFLKINSKGSVPTLVVNGGEILTEGAAILQYLADTHHKTQLLPAPTDFKRYRVLEWLNFIASDLHKSFGPLFNPKMPQDIRDDFYIPLLTKRFTLTDKHLHHNHFLIGDQFTLADAYLFVMLRWAYYFKFDFDAWPHLARYFAELKQRKSIEKAMQEEGL